MNPRRVAVLLHKEFTHGIRSFMFIFAVVIPIALSLVVVLMFGDLFSGKPKLGITDKGSSELVPMATAVDALVVKEYNSEDDLKQAVEAGAVDAGVVLPSDFDRLVRAGDNATLTAYIWGESLLKNRIIVGVTMAFLVRDLSGLETPVEIATTTVGDGESMPWEERLLPVMVLMAVILGGSLVPATSLVEEKQKRTLKALIITPTTLGDVFASKGLLGAILSFVMAIVVLALNGAFRGQALLLVVLGLGAIMAASIGLLLGAFIKDIDTLFAVLKSIGILIYAPAIVYLFPGIPQWIGKIFPTYYLIAPVLEISQRGATWPDVALEVFILIGLIVALLAVVAVAVRRLSQHEF